MLPLTPQVHKLGSEGTRTLTTVSLDPQQDSDGGFLYTAPHRVAVRPDRRRLGWPQKQEHLERFELSTCRVGADCSSC